MDKDETLSQILAELRELNARQARAETALGHLLPRLVTWGRAISSHPKIAKLLKSIQT